MPFLKRNEKVNCEFCGIQTTNLARHNNRCSVGTLYCTKCRNFPTTSQEKSTYQIAKKHIARKISVTLRLKISNEKLSGFYALRHLKKASIDFN